MSVTRLLFLFLIFQFSSVFSSAQELDKLIQLSEKKVSVYMSGKQYDKAIFEWVNLSSLYWAQDKRKEAIKLLLTTKKVAGKHSNIYHVSFINTRLADYYTQMGKKNYALRRYEDNIELYQDTKQYKSLLNSLFRASRLALEDNKHETPMAEILPPKGMTLT